MKQMRLTIQQTANFIPVSNVKPLNPFSCSREIVPFLPRKKILHTQINKEMRNRLFHRPHVATSYNAARDLTYSSV